MFIVGVSMVLSYANRQGQGQSWARQALHACRLAVRHPTTGRPLAIEAPMPGDLAGLVSRLRRSARR